MTNETQIKDHSRFNRWIKEMDEKDRSLNGKVRRRKWMLIFTFVLLLFLLSFFLFPGLDIRTENLEVISKPENKFPERSPFELPVDSFHHQLSILIHEKTTQKK